MGAKLEIVAFVQGLPTFQKAIVTLVVILVAVFILLLLWYPQSTQNAASTTSIPSRPTPIVWDDHLGHSYSGAGASLNTSAFQIGVKNNLGHELRLERAYAISGEGAGEKELEIAADGNWTTASSLRPLGDQQTFVIRINFESQLAKAVFENWKTFQITLVYNGGQIDRKNITEAMVKSVYANFKPSPIGPQVRMKE